MWPVQIRVKNFLSYEDSGKVDLDNKTIIVGENNAGKSNFVDAVREFFNFSNRTRQDLKRFYNQDEDRQIQITVWFDELTDDEKEMFNNGTGVPNDAELAVRLVSEYNSEERRAETNDYQLLIENEEGEKEWIKPTGLTNDLSNQLPDVSHYGAERELDDAIKTSRKSSLLYKLLGSAYDEIPDDEVKDLEEDWKDLKTSLEEELPQPIEDLIENLDDKMDEQVNIDDKLDIEFEIPTVREMIQRQAKVQINKDRDITLNDMGSGSQMSFIFSCIQVMAERNTENVFLTLEEPENYLHPHSIRRLHTSLSNLANEGNFILLTTHSPELAAPGELDHIRRVEQSRNGSKIRQPRDQLQKADVEVMKTTESAETSEIFFSRSLLICEGPSDKSTLNIANRILAEENDDKHTFDAQGVSVLHVHGKPNIPKYLRVADEFGIPAVAVMDTDADRDTDPKKINWGTIRKCRRLSDEFFMLEGDLERELFDAIELKDFHETMQHLSKLNLATDYNETLPSLKKELQNNPGKNKTELLMKLFGDYSPSKPALARELANQCDVNSFSGDLENIINSALNLSK